MAVAAAAEERPPNTVGVAVVVSHLHFGMVHVTIRFHIRVATALGTTEDVAVETCIVQRTDDAAGHLHRSLSVGNRSDAACP